MKEQLSIYYNGELPETRTMMGYAKSLGIPVKAIDIRNAPLTPLQWLNFSGKLNVHVSELVRTDRVAKLSDRASSMSEDDWAQLLAKEPSLMRKPIGERNERVAILSTASDILQL